MATVQNPICPAKPPLEARLLLRPEQAGEMAALFKILANDTRLRLLHALARAGEMCVAEISAALTMKPQAISNQLQHLVARGILASRRQGLNIFYRIEDPCVVSLLGYGLCLAEDAKERRK